MTPSASLSPLSSTHASAARILEAGIDVLVEKPIAASLAEADALIASAKRSKGILQVGHVERFNPAIVAARKIVSRPMFFEIHRLGIFSPRSLDIDVVYDVMIHDLDILLSLVNAPVVDLKAVGIPVITEKVDIAHARVEFETGTVANLTASRVSTERVRKMRFFQEHEYVSLDFTRQDVLRVRVDSRLVQAAPGKRFGSGVPEPSPSQKSHSKKFPPRPKNRFAPSFARSSNPSARARSRPLMAPPAAALSNSPTA